MIIEMADIIIDLGKENPVFNDITFSATSRIDY